MKPSIIRSRSFLLGQALRNAGRSGADLYEIYTCDEFEGVVRQIIYEN